MKPITKQVEESSLAVELREVTRIYHTAENQETVALSDISLRIKRGEMVAITGASGSGKSTLLQLIGGLDRPTSGTIRVNGHLIPTHGTQLAAYRNQSVGFVFQSFYLQPFLTVGKNIEIPLMFARMDRALRPERIKQVVAAVGLDDRVNHLPKELSGGQIQRAAIARALVHKPGIILADEPTGNLDSVNSAAVMKLLTDICHTEGTTVIIVTHDATVSAAADRTIHIKDGKVLV